VDACSIHIYIIRYARANKQEYSYLRREYNGVRDAHFGGRGKAVFDPLQRIENQCSEKAKTMFETSRTTSNVVFLMSYVRIIACGKGF
jgi:hypothetical protein